MVDLLGTLDRDELELNHLTTAVRSPVKVYPGENEMGALRVLSGREPAKDYPPA